MTEYIIKTTKEEADEIFCGAKSFVFRTSKIKYYLSDRIKFQVIKDKKVLRHPIDKHIYMVTYSSRQAPIEDGYSVVGFRRVV